MKYAVALSEQSKYGPTVIAGFTFLPECNLHVWKSVYATNAHELCEQMNVAYAALQEYGSPFTTLRVVELEAEVEEQRSEDRRQRSDEDERLIAELRETILRLEEEKKANIEHRTLNTEHRIKKPNRVKQRKALHATGLADSQTTPSRIVQLPKGIWGTSNTIVTAKEAATG